MGKAGMILYSPASYFLCIIVAQIIKESIFLWDICAENTQKNLFLLAF